MNNENESGNIANESRPRRTSVGAFNGFFRSNSTASQQGTPVFPNPINTANTGRRMSITATLGLASTSPSQPSPFFQRRASVSTAGSDSLNESAIDEEDGPPAGSNPFGRRMSIGGQSFYNARAAANSTNGDGLNWSEQFRSRAESTMARPPSFSGTSPTNSYRSGGLHQRAQSVAEMPPQTMPANRAENSALRKKPDETGERILRGQFYMD